MSKLGCDCGALLNDDEQCYYAYLPDDAAEHAIGDSAPCRELWQCYACGKILEVDNATGKVVASWTKDCHES